MLFPLRGLNPRPFAYRQDAYPLRHCAAARRVPGRIARCIQYGCHSKALHLLITIKTK